MKLKETLKNFPKTRSRLTAFLLLCVICILSMGAVNDAAVKEITVRDVNVYENVDNSIVVKTRQATVGQLLSENNIVLGDFDNCNFLCDEELSDDSTIIIRRGVPFSVATVDGVTQASTTKATVGEALIEAGIDLNEFDEVNPPVETAVSAGMTINVSKVTIDKIVVKESIPYTTSKKETESLAKGETEIVQRGEKGLKSVVYEVVYKDGKEISRDSISEEIIYEPTKEIIKVGTKEKEKTVATKSSKSSKSSKGNLSSRGNVRYKKVYTMKATAYDPSPSSNGGHTKTAMGTAIKYGVVAVDPSVIPLGSRLYIESTDDGKSWTYGYAIAADTGGAIKGNKIDLCYNTSSEARRFGVKQAKVYVLE